MSKLIILYVVFLWEGTMRMGRFLKQHSILFTLFVPFTMLFIIAFAILMWYFIVTESEKAKSDSFVTMQNNAVTISDSLDAEVLKLDTVSQNIIYSSVMKESFYEFMQYQDGRTGSEAQKLHNREVLSDVLISMIGPNTPVNQVYVYSLNTGGIGVGLNNTDLSLSVQDKSWYSEVRQASGSKVLCFGEDPSLSKFSSSGEDQKYISLCRMFYSATNVPQGIVEVKKSFDAISDMIQGYQHSYSEKIYIMDSQGNLVYPTDISDTEMEYCNFILSQNQEDSPYSAIGQTGDVYVLSHTSTYTGFSTVVAVSQNELLQPIQQYVMANIAMMLVIMVFIVILSFFLARFISRPLNRIHANLKKFDITDDQSQEFLPVETHITELNTLYKAFLKMQKKARDSMQRELTLQNREMQAKMLALQAQMNPHFLYNSLSTIQAMADEGMGEQIINMCQSMSRMLRYISSDKEQLVSVSQEIAHTKDYLDCMQTRFEDDFSYKIIIPQDLEEVHIPKLCLQLIVENSIKFMTKAKYPPWNIAVVGSYTDSEWRIEVQDNGPGFAPEKLEELNEKIRYIEKTGVLPDLELNGMGLMNIYIRLKLFYQGKHIFEMRNQENGGAVVVIGGVNQNE